jgi:tRNA dimethylallyltransferase
MTKPLLIAVMGPTASGKSALAEQLAEELNAVILNADAFQVYRGMDIGTAKPVNQSRYELLDLKSPNENFGVGEYVVLASERLHEHFQAGRNSIVCGGTGYYVRALIEEFTDLNPAPDPGLRESLEERLKGEGLETLASELVEKAPDQAAKTDLKNPVRVRRALERVYQKGDAIRFTLPPYQKYKVSITPNIENSSVKIAQRTKTMVQNGWIREVEALLDQGYGSGDPGFRAIGYELIEQFILNGGSEVDLTEKIILDTVQYAKRQRTWLRSEPNLNQFSEFSEAYDATMSYATSIEY